jgi:RimJ/RimL family protein N-acetyltransferase
VDQPSFLSERLLLRPRSHDDIEACVAINSDPEVMRFLGAVWPPERQRSHLTAQVERDWGPGLGYWSIFERGGTGSDLFGWVLLISSEGHGAPELGYRLRRSAWGRGVATEAARAIVDHGREGLGLETIMAIAHRDNVASHGVLGKLGFQPGEEDISRGVPERVFRLAKA